MTIKAVFAGPGSPEVPWLEKESGGLAYNLYGRTPEEIAIVEGVNT